jgi:isoleucyl-tRNA synthetase
MAVSTGVFDKSSYRNVLCLGHILDDKGRKMSKHLGNVLEPIELMDEHGADAVRWFMLAAGSPWQSRRLGHQNIDDVVRRVLLTYWNTASFLSLYGRVSDGEPPYAAAPAMAERPIMDRWAISRAHEVVHEVDECLANFDTQRAGRLLAEFVDDLSNWYVRRTRRRFWAGEASALATLHEVLRMVTLAMAPFTPFITEKVWQDLFARVPGQALSVHLAAWPKYQPELVIAGLSEQVSLVRRLTELGRGARAASKVKVRQPLSRALVSASGWAGLPQELRDELAEELNIMAVSDLAASTDLVTINLKPNFRNLGAKFSGDTQAVAQAITAASPIEIAQQLRTAGCAQIKTELPTPELAEVVIDVNDVIITEQPREGWAVSSNAGETVALDLTLTPELKRTGLAREVIRLVQEARKTSGFEVSDRIEISWWSAEPQTTQAIEEHAATIAGEVLATKMVQAKGVGAPTQTDPDLKAEFWLTKA